ncbi:MAG: hypothetical protein HDP34_05635 [Clostridia bacterium]|nr:hypothetical protein [Clostridia bacterium]
MKAKKLVALGLTCAMAVTTVSLFAACGPKEPEGGNYVEDTTTYHVAGTSKNPDLPLAWSEKLEGKTDAVILKKDTSITNENVYTIQMKLYAGDMFKIVHDESWDNEINAYYFAGAEDDADVGTVTKNEAGEVVFSSESTSSSNIKLAEGHDGIYTFTLKTYPDKESTEKYVLTYKLDESIPRLKVPYKMAIYGDMNGWGYGNNMDDYEMSNSGTSWTGVVEVTEDRALRDETGKKYTKDTKPTDTTLYAGLFVYNEGDYAECDTLQTYTPAVPEEDTFYKVVTLETAPEEKYPECKTIVLLPVGVYTIQFNQAVAADGETPATEASVVVNEGALKLYFIGSMNNWSESYDNDELLLNKSEDGSAWTGILTITEEDYADGKDYAEVQLYNIYLDDYINEGDGNIKLTAGKYAFKYTVDGATVVHEKLGFWLVGSLDGTHSHWGIPAENPETPKFVESETTPGVYTAEYTFTVDNAEVKVVLGSQLLGIADYDIVHGAGTGNVAVGSAGTYVFTVTATTTDGNTTYSFSYALKS